MTDQNSSTSLPPSGFKAPVVPPPLPKKDKLDNSKQISSDVVQNTFNEDKTPSFKPLAKTKPVEMLPIKKQVDLSSETKNDLSSSSIKTDNSKQGDLMEETEIRTMQDDLEAARNPTSAKKEVVDRKKTPIKEVIVKPISGSGIPFMANNNPANVHPTQTKQVVTSPSIKPHSRRRRGARRVLWAILLLLVISFSGAAGTWFFYFKNQGAVTKPDVRVDASQIIPANTSLLLQYRFNSAQDRKDIIGIWGGDLPATPVTAAATVAGNPRSLAQDEAITEAFYLLLNDDVRPYLVVPVTDMTKKLFEKATDVQVSKKDGWYIVHTLSTDPYNKVLAENSLSSAGQADWLREEDQGPIHLLLSSNMLPPLRRDLLGDNFIGGQLNNLSLTGQITNGGQNISFISHPSVKSLSSGAVDPNILALVPSNSTAVYLGTSFTGDLALWRTTSSAPSTNILDSPSVTQRLSLLTTPYALFSQNLPSGRSFGLIVNLPDGFAPTNAEQAAAVSITDSSIEQALPAFIPLLVLQPLIAPVSFSDANYRGIPLRYSNIVNSAEALDYTIIGNHLLVASSKDTMFALIDAALGSGGSIKDNPGVAAFLSGNKVLALTSNSGLPSINDFVLGSLHLPQLAQFLPSSGSSVSDRAIMFGLTTQADVNQPKSGETRLILQAAVDLANKISPTVP